MKDNARVELLTTDEAAAMLRRSTKTVTPNTYDKVSGWPLPRRMGKQGRLRRELTDIER